MFVYSLHDPSGHPLLAAIAKRSYRVHRGTCFAEPTSPAIVVDPRHAPSENPGASERIEHARHKIPGTLRNRAC